MTITLTPETENLLRQKAQREGADVNTIADTLLAAILRWEAEEQETTMEGIRRGLEASDAGQVRPFAEFASQMRTQYQLPTHLSDEEIGANQ
jgi:predicted transcriptional regulator